MSEKKGRREGGTDVKYTCIEGGLAGARSACIPRREMNGSGHTDRDAAPQLAARRGGRLTCGPTVAPEGGWLLARQIATTACRIRSPRTAQELQTLVPPLLFNIISPLSLSTADPSQLAILARLTLYTSPVGKRCLATPAERAACPMM